MKGCYRDTVAVESHGREVRRIVLAGSGSKDFGCLLVQDSCFADMGANEPAFACNSQWDFFDQINQLTLADHETVVGQPIHLYCQRGTQIAASHDKNYLE